MERLSDNENPSAGDRYHVRSVGNALGLLSVFTQDERRLTLTALARRTGIPRPTALRLLRTLEEAGFVRRLGHEYSLGFRCFILGNIVRADLDIERVALPFLDSLCDATGETTQLAVLEEWQIVYLARVRPRQPVAYMRSRVGTILPAYCTGLGKALLATQPVADVAAWAATQQFQRLTPTTITTASDLLAELERIRARGYALDLEEREPGVACVAAAVRDDHGCAIAAISVAGPVERMPQQLEGSETARTVVATAAAISEAIGYVPSRPAGSEMGPGSPTLVRDEGGTAGNGLSTVTS